MTPPKTNGPAQADSPLPVVDSFLLRDGRVVRPDLHRARFARGALAAGADQLELDDFFRHVDRVFAGQASNGDWFPKLSWDGREFSCQIRPAPALRSTTTLAVISQSDPRRFPQIKGPDMETLGRQRAAAREVGADDAVVVEGSEIFEAANGALVFFDEEGPFAALPPRGSNSYLR